MVQSATTEVKGPYVQDRLGRRFGPADVLAAAARHGLLVGRLGLTDAQGGPLCARVEPPHITWTAARAG